MKCLYFKFVLRETIPLHPNALQDGNFFVEFFLCHPGDAFYNVVNQRCWLEYHPKSAFNRPQHQLTAHFIHPSSNSEDYAIAKGLVPFRQWVRLSNAYTYTIGPFEFATLNGLSTRDHIPKDH